MKEDRLGLDFVYLLVLRWDCPVGSAAVRDLVGRLLVLSADKGVLLTSLRFSKDAAE